MEVFYPEAPLARSRDFSLRDVNSAEAFSTGASFVFGIGLFKISSGDSVLQFGECPYRVSYLTYGSSQAVLIA